MKSKIDLAEGVLAGLFFGTAAIFIRYLKYLDSLSIGFYRLFISSGILFIFVLFFRQRIKLTIHRYFLRLIILGLLIGLHFVAFISAIKMTTVINATVLVNTTPAIIVVFYWLLGKKPAFMTILGLILGMCGIITVSIAELTLSYSGLIGDLLALLAAVLWAGYLIVGKPVREECNVLLIMPPIYFIGSAIILTISLLIGHIPVVPAMSDLFPLIGLSLFPTAIGHTLHFSSMKTLRPYQTSILALLEPVTATFLAFLFFNEIPSLPFFIGAILVLLGIYIIIRMDFH